MEYKWEVHDFYWVNHYTWKIFMKGYCIKNTFDTGYPSRFSAMQAMKRAAEELGIRLKGLKEKSDE